VTAPSTNSYIAIVDDDAAIRSALGRALRMENYDVELFEDGLSALKAIQLRAPDAIVLELAASGYRRTRDLSSHSPFRGHDARFLMLTARDARERPRGPVSTWAPTTTSSSPFDLAELLARMRALLRRHNPHRGRWCGTALRGPFTESPDPRSSSRPEVGRTHEDRVRPAGVVFTSPTTGAHPRSDPRPRLGLQLRLRDQLPGGLHRLSSPQARRGRTKCD